MARLIGVTGKARAGKDTIGLYLSVEHRFRRESFAAPLKHGIQIMFGLGDEHVNGEFKEDVIPWLGRSPRYLMQTLGTEWGREIVDQDVWLKIAQQKWIACQEADVDMVVTDVRFENEAAWIREEGDLIHVMRRKTQQVEAHSSEAGCVKVPGDFVILNDRSIEDLEARVWRVLEAIG